MAYLEKIYTGVLIFPLIAVVFTLPYIFSQYHRYGSVSFLRTLILYSFILYMLIAYFQIILPLPEREATIGSQWRKHLNLIPFRQIWLYWRSRSFGMATLLAYLKSFSLWQLLLNIVLTVPFGVYLRYYFRQSFARTLLYSFLLSLFYELTQLSALYGIYPGPYRLADVEDLICNTLGGVFGYWLASVFMRLLPSREVIDARSRAAGQRISGLRRFLAAAFDYVCSLFLFLFLRGLLLLFLPEQPEESVYEPLNSWSFFCLFSLIQVLLCRGRTLGHALCRLLLGSEKGGPATAGQLVKRYVLLWVFTELPLLFVKLLPAVPDSPLYDVGLLLLTLASRGYFLYYAFRELFRKDARPLPHDTLSGTAYLAVVTEAADRALPGLKKQK